MNRVLVVDDHSLVRAGISLLLEHQDDMEPVGQAGTAAEAIRLTADLAPDIVLLDVTLPGGSGLECLPELLVASPGVKVLMLSMHEDASYVRAALSAGAAGYVLKDAAYEELVDAIRKVADGQSYVAPALGAKLAVQSESTADDELSEREREVLSLLARGYTEPGDRGEAVRQRPHRRVPPRAHPDETPALDPGGSRELRARVRAYCGRSRKANPVPRAPDTVPAPPSAARHAPTTVPLNAEPPPRTPLTTTSALHARASSAIAEAGWPSPSTTASRAGIPALRSSAT